MPQPEPMRVLIADDEAAARLRLADLLRDDPHVGEILEASDGRMAVQMILDHQPDLLLLDVQMPELTGLEVIAAVGPARLPLTIFVTAYDQHAISAFQANALDYLLKPFSDERMQAAMARARQRLEDRQLRVFGESVARMLGTQPSQPSHPQQQAPQLQQAQQPQQQPQQPQQPSQPQQPQQPSQPQQPQQPSQPSQPSALPDRLVVKSMRATQFVRVAEIDWIESAGVHVMLHARGKEVLHRISLSELAGQLDPQCFVRVHRSLIVNIDSIAQLEPLSHGEFEVVMKDGARRRVSRTYRALLEQRLGQPL